MPFVCRVCMFTQIPIYSALQGFAGIKVYKCTHGLKNGLKTQIKCYLQPFLDSFLYGFARRILPNSAQNDTTQPPPRKATHTTSKTRTQ